MTSRRVKKDLVLLLFVKVCQQFLVLFWLCNINLFSNTAFQPNMEDRLMAGSLILSDNKFYIAGPAAEKARRP